MKNNKGITLVALIVTIVVIAILLGVGISVGTNSLEHAKMVKFVSNMQIIQKQVDMYTSEKLQTLGNEIPNIEKVTNILSLCSEITDKNISNYRYFNEEQLSETFGIDNVEDDIVVNFKTKEVVSLNRSRIQ